MSARAAPSCVTSNGRRRPHGGSGAPDVAVRGIDMSGESFEWAIKKDVRNNPIVREVDLERHREMWRSVGISVFLVVVLLFIVWQQNELKQYGYRMETAQDELEKEEITARQLRLEIETLRAPERIQDRAVKQLHMIEPGPGDAAVIERVFEPAAPPKSVVAQR